MSYAPAPAGWYPDPSRAHEWRYFDGERWTDHVSDRGTASQAPLGPTPPGLITWFRPEVIAQSAVARPPRTEVPRAKMWILAVLSAFVFWLSTPNTTIVLPFGVVFAIWCWATTSAPLKSLQQEGSPAVKEIKAARWVAFGLAVFGLSQAAIWTH